MICQHMKIMIVFFAQKSLEYFMNLYKMWKRGLLEKDKCDYIEIAENGVADLSKAGEFGITPSYSVLKRMSRW